MEDEIKVHYYLQMTACFNINDSVQTYFSFACFYSCTLQRPCELNVGYQKLQVQRSRNDQEQVHRESTSSVGPVNSKHCPVSRFLLLICESEITDLNLQEYSSMELCLDNCS